MRHYFQKQTKMVDESIEKRIENEVRKQEWNITEFAKAICCRRGNVYNIFRRSTIDIQLLARISKVLKHNYFKDLADNPELAEIEIEESEKDKKDRVAVSQFFEVMPRVLTRIGMNNRIIFNKSERATDNDIPTPDMMLPDYLVCFTIGERWVDKAKISESKFFSIKTIKSEDGISVDVVENKLYKSVMIDIVLDYKSEQDWEKTMRFVKDNCLYLAKLPQRFFCV